MTDSFEEAMPVAEETENTAQGTSFVREKLLLWVQLGLCAAVIITALILKGVGGTLYASVATWYYDNYHDSVFPTSESAPPLFGDETSLTEVSRKSFEEAEAHRNSSPAAGSTSAPESGTQP